MSRQKKKGFTLVELVVVLVIMTVILGIAIPSVLHYMKMAEFRKNEENAKTVYLAAESKLTYYRSSGQWEEFKKEVMSQGKEAPFTDSKRKGKIYGITLDKEHDGASASNNAVLGLLDGYTYDKSMLDASIAIEIDIESGEVYSAFYGTRCKGLNYASQDGNGYLTMADREYKSRKDRVLGYYSVEDTVNVVALKPTRLKMNTISLLNGEVLSLNWSSNVGNRLDVEYDIQFYQKNGKDKEDSLLFSMAVAPAQLRSAGWDTDSSKARNMVPVELKDAEGKSAGTWYFPITLQDGKYVLTLDAMMSAEILGVLSSSQNKDGELDATTSTSILRLAKVAESLKEQQTIYACIQAVPYYQRGSQSTNEYRSSEKVTSNSSNTLYGDDSTENNIKVAYFRQLSNIRYEEEDTKKEITLTNRNMDWSAVGTGLYTFALQEEGEGQAIRRPVWYRVHGKLAKSQLQFSGEELRALLMGSMDERKKEIFASGRDVDFGLEISDGSRQRVNIFRQQHQVAAAIRLLNTEIPTLEQLRMPTRLYQMAQQPRGLILVTGPTGSGKSTTLAAMIEHVNQNSDRHIITIEDPIEYKYQCKKSLIHQREVGEDVGSFADALRSALREDPDVILVGEMRDYETISAALLAAETGHLVLSTLHTTGAAQTVERIIDACPTGSQNQIRIQLAAALKGIVSQCLIPCGEVKGAARIAGTELLVATDAILNLIREGKTHQISAMMQAGGNAGMHTLNMDLSRLMRQGYITKERAREYTNNPAELEQYMM